MALDDFVQVQVSDLMKELRQKYEVFVVSALQNQQIRSESNQIIVRVGNLKVLTADDS